MRLNRCRPAASPLRSAASGRSSDFQNQVRPLGASGAAATRADIRFSKGSLVSVQYDEVTRSYRGRQDGREMPGMQPPNVQRVQIRPAKYKDVLGLPTRYTVTVGSGVATVLRDRRRIDGSWRRPTPDSGTRFVYGSGSDILLRPGPTWVLLVPDGQPLTGS